MRANTGKAVMLMAAPRKRANAGKVTCRPDSRGYKNSAASEPRKNGRLMLTWLVSSTARPRLRILVELNSNPTRNMNSNSPT